ncbi:NAD-dependent protein deacetylase sirtuin-2, partial [Perkinsus olseni]
VGTSLRVMPFAALIGSVPSSTPRLLINREPTGLLGDPHNPSGFGNRGFRFHLDDNYRDVAMLGDCDSSITRLCRMCGWMEDLLEVERECLREHQGEPNLLWELVAASQRKTDDILPAELAAEDLAPGPRPSSTTIHVPSDSAPQIDDTAAMLSAGQSPIPSDLDPNTFPNEGRGTTLALVRAALSYNRSTAQDTASEWSWRLERGIACKSNDNDPANDTSADDRSTLARPYESLISSFRHSLRRFAEACSVLEIRHALSSLAEATMKEVQVELLCEDKSRLRVHQERRANLDAYLVRRSPSNGPESAKQAAVESVWLVEEGTGTLHLPTADTVKEILGAPSQTVAALAKASAAIPWDTTRVADLLNLGAIGFYCEPLIMGDWEVLKKYLSHSGRSGRENDVQDPEGQSRAAEKFRHTAERYNAVKALMKVPSGLHPRYMHRREVQGCIERWRQGLIERFAYYSGIWLNGKDGERRLAGMIWSAISCELPSVDANSRFEKFTRVCAETSARFCFLDVSYWVADWAEGQGLVTAAVIVMSAFVKEELCAADNVTELLLYCRDDNLRSQAVARGLGFLPTTNANADNCLTLQLDDMW